MKIKLSSRVVKEHLFLLNTHTAHIYDYLLVFIFYISVLNWTHLFRINLYLNISNTKKNKPFYCVIIFLTVNNQLDCEACNTVKLQLASDFSWSFIQVDCLESTIHPWRLRMITLVRTEIRFRLLVWKICSPSILLSKKWRSV